MLMSLWLDPEVLELVLVQPNYARWLAHLLVGRV
jgi:hypothetical protein